MHETTDCEWENWEGEIPDYWISIPEVSLASHPDIAVEHERALLESGTRKRTSARSSRKKTSAESSKTLSVVPDTSGSGTQRLAQDVAQLFGTGEEIGNSQLTLICALASFLLDPFQNSDGLYLKLLQTKKFAIKMGVPEDEAQETIMKLAQFFDRNQPGWARSFMG